MAGGVAGGRVVVDGMQWWRMGCRGGGWDAVVVDGMQRWWWMGCRGGGWDAEPVRDKGEVVGSVRTGWDPGGRDGIRADGMGSSIHLQQRPSRVAIGQKGVRRTVGPALYTDGDVAWRRLYTLLGAGDIPVDGSGDVIGM